jgi:hypothetical protein
MTHAQGQTQWFLSYLGLATRGSVSSFVQSDSAMCQSNSEMFYDWFVAVGYSESWLTFPLSASTLEVMHDLDYYYSKTPL